MSFCRTRVLCRLVAGRGLVYSDIPIPSRQVCPPRLGVGRTDDFRLAPDILPGGPSYLEKLAFFSVCREVTSLTCLHPKIITGRTKIGVLGNRQLTPATVVVSATMDAIVVVGDDCRSISFCIGCRRY